MQFRIGLQVQLVLVEGRDTDEVQLLVTGGTCWMYIPFRLLMLKAMMEECTILLLLYALIWHIIYTPVAERPVRETFK